MSLIFSDMIEYARRKSFKFSALDNSLMVCSFSPDGMSIHGLSIIQLDITYKVLCSSAMISLVHIEDKAAK